MDKTYVRVKGRWCYLYRAIDSRGAIIDSLLSALRDADAAKRLFRKALGDRAHPQPRVINTDLAPIYSSAIPDSKRKGRCGTCGPQKPLRVEICMTPGADSGLFLRLFQRTLFGVLALCEADLPCCHFEAFGSVTSAPALLSSGNSYGQEIRTV